MTDRAEDGEKLSFPLRVRRTLGRIRRSFGNDVYDVFARPVRDEDRDFEAPEGYRFDWATPEDIEGCDELHTELDEGERTRGVRRLAFGHRAVAAFHGDLVVFTMWVNPRNANVPGLIKRQLGDHQEFIYKAYTSPDHRGKKLYQAGMRFVLADMASRGLTELVGYAHVKKKVSRAGLARLHFHSLGTFRELRAPGWTTVLVSKELSGNLPQAQPRTNVLSASEAAV